MRALFSAFVLTALLNIFSSCATPPVQPAGIGGFTGGSDGSDLVIRTSGFRFPARIGPFVRGQTQQYDATGLDLSVKYQAGALIVADIYEYPSRGKSLTTEFADRKAEIAFYHSDARLVTEGEATVHPGGKTRHGYKAHFLISKGYKYSFPPPYESDLLVFQNGDRFIEYRFSYSAAHQERAKIEVARFIDALAWPKG
jgi:hypothetical protein